MKIKLDGHTPSALAMTRNRIIETESMNELRLSVTGGACVDRKDEEDPRPNISVALRHSLKPTGHVDIDIRSPWIGPRVCKVQAWSVFRYDFGLQTLVFWKPFKIKEAAVWLDVLAAVGADWKTPLKSGSITFAGINFGGNLIYVSEPEAVLSGKMYGNVTVLGLKIGVEMEAKKKFS